MSVADECQKGMKLPVLLNKFYEELVSSFINYISFVNPKTFSISQHSCQSSSGTIVPPAI